MRRINMLFGLLVQAGTMLALSDVAPAYAGTAHGTKTADASAHGAMEMTETTGMMAMDAWIPTAPPTVKAHAAYLMLHNEASEARTVTAVSSPQYEMAHLHVSRMENGVATMQSLAQVEVPAGGMAAFEPGGMHIMLMKPKAEMKAGDEVEIVLTLDDGSLLTVAAQVKERPQGAKMNHGHGTTHTH